MRPLFYSLILLLVISSCSTTNDVASGRRIQKRKYNKGFHFKKRKSSKGKVGVKSELFYAQKKIPIEISKISRAEINVLADEKNESKNNFNSKSSNINISPTKTIESEEIIKTGTIKHKQTLSTYDYEEDEYRAALYTAKKRVLWAIWGVLIPYLGFFLIPFQLFLGIGARRIESYISLLTTLAFLSLIIFALATFTVNPIIPIALVVLGLGTIIFNYVILIWELMVLNYQIKNLD